MAGIKELSVGRSDVFLVQMEDVEVRPGWNCRDVTSPGYQEGIRALADQIVGAGSVKQALTGSMIDGHLVVTDGHRRLDAIKFLRKNRPDAPIDWRLPIRMEPPKATEADRIISQIVRNSGVPFTPIEQAAVVHRLLEEGLTTAEVASKIGYTETRVRQLSEIHAMPEQVKDQIREGAVSATMAHNVMRKAASPEAGVITIDDAVKLAKAGGKKKATMKHTDGGKARKPAKSKAEIKAAATAIVGALSTLPGPKKALGTREDRERAFAAVRSFFDPSNVLVTELSDGKERLELIGTISSDSLEIITTFFEIPKVERFI